MKIKNQIKEKMKLGINKFEIEVDEWNIEKNFFWLRYDDGDSLGIRLAELEDLKEIIRRFEERLNENK